MVYIKTHIFKHFYYSNNIWSYSLWPPVIVVVVVVVVLIVAVVFIVVVVCCGTAVILSYGFVQRTVVLRNVLPSNSLYTMLCSNNSGTSTASVGKKMCLLYSYYGGP